MKIVVTNSNTEKHAMKLLFVLSDYRRENFGLPTGIDLKFYPNEAGSFIFSYPNLLDAFRFNPVGIRFTSSTNNRQLTFLYLPNPYFPIHKNIDILDPEFISEKGEDLGKFNIADSKELTIWNSRCFVLLEIEPSQVFELEFIPISGRNAIGRSLASGLR
jgi:hypothetical protein